eukprot:3939497-Rhodomonas_salina.1
MIGRHAVVICCAYMLSCYTCATKCPPLTQPMTVPADLEDLSTEDRLDAAVRYGLGRQYRLLCSKYVGRQA